MPFQCKGRKENVGQQFLIVFVDEKEIWGLQIILKSFLTVVTVFTHDQSFTVADPA